MKLINYWKPIVISIFILYGSITSGENLDKVQFLHFDYMDKFVHFFIYMGFSVSIISSFYKYFF